MLFNPSKPCTTEPFRTIPAAIINHTIYVPASANGIPTIAVIDTGAETTLITPALAAAAKAPVSEATKFNVGVNGSFRVHQASLHQIIVGSIGFNAESPVIVLDFTGSQGTKIGMQVGMNLLGYFDFDLDLPHQKITPYRLHNCAAFDPPWPTLNTGIAIKRDTSDGYAKARPDFIGAGPSNPASVEVQFDGGILDALFDTGSARSMLSHEGAKAAGASSRALASDPIKTVKSIDNADTSVVLHTFPNVAIGEEEFHNYPMYVARHFDRRDTDMILGMDYIATHHLWLSFTTNALYIDSGETKPPAPPPPPSTKPAK